MSAEKVIEIARGELGTTEWPAGSNKVKYWDKYDKSFQGQPWCVAFLWWCFSEAGERMAFFGGGKTASCSTLLRWYREQGLTVPVDQVQPGDIVLLNFNWKGTPDHCGLATSGIEDGFYVQTIEGNTTLGEEGQDNGGCVLSKKRRKSQIVEVCRPMYTKKDEKPKDDISGHWAEKSIRKAVKNGTMTGFPDGSFRPNDPLTRAELATILDRLGFLG